MRNIAAMIDISVVDEMKSRHHDLHNWHSREEENVIKNVPRVAISGIQTINSCILLGST